MTTYIWSEGSKESYALELTAELVTFLLGGAQATKTSAVFELAGKPADSGGVTHAILVDGSIIETIISDQGSAENDGRLRMPHTPPAIRWQPSGPIGVHIIREGTIFISVIPPK